MTESWSIRKDREGLYAVHDENGYPVGIDCTRERALLIAAAPEMLAALEAQQAASLETGYSAWKLAQDRADKLRYIALAKARGETVPDSETQDLSGHPGESESDRESGTKNA